MEDEIVAPASVAAPQTGVRDSPKNVAVILGHDHSKVVAILALTNELNDMLLEGQTFIMSPVLRDDEKMLCVSVVPNGGKQAGVT